MTRELPKNHNASVYINDDGVLVANTDTINFSEKEIENTNRKMVAVVPNEDETVKSFSEVPEVFERLTSINVSLTNACNLSCNYCYEQHNKDYGRFTVETIKQAYDFLLGINNLPNKTLIFFGGEPLIHQKLILDFLKTHKQELEENANKVRINIISNGLLLSPSFIEEYFSYDYTDYVLSLDTFDSSRDQRKIPQHMLDKLKDMVLTIPEEVRHNGRITVRPTVSFSTAPLMPQFMVECYELGIRSFIVQPLIMANLDGFVNWPEEEWVKLKTDIYNFVRTYEDITVEVTEGMAKRTMGNSCLNKMDIISIDPSGDFSGCFFFVNQKADAGNMISGNIWSEKVYTDRQDNFDKALHNMYETEPECRVCDLQDYCYQCPAGNLDTTGSLFRPDGMCKKFVGFYLEMNRELFKIRYKRAMSKIVKGVAENGDAFIKEQLIEYFYKDHREFSYPKQWMAQHSLETICGIYYDMCDDYTVTRFETERTLGELYDRLMEDQPIFIDETIHAKLSSIDKRVFYLTMLGATLYE